MLFKLSLITHIIIQKHNNFSLNTSSCYFSHLQSINFLNNNYYSSTFLNQYKSKQVYFQKLISSIHFSWWEFQMFFYHMFITVSSSSAMFKQFKITFTQMFNRNWFEEVRQTKFFPIGRTYYLDEISHHQHLEIN